MNFPFAETSLFSSQLLLLFCVVLVKWGLIKTNNLAHINWFSLYCQRLADKVNNPSNGIGQQRLSGTIALTINLFTLVMIVWLFESFIAVPWLWHALLLFLAIGSVNLSQISRKLLNQLHNNQKYQAKALLQPWVLRDCTKLSSIGLSKAFIEMYLLRTSQQLIAPAFYFLLLGPYAAFAYRLILEMHYAWNPKLKKYQHFSTASHTLIRLLEWLPNRLLSTIFLLQCAGQHFVLIWRLIRRHIFQLNNHLLLHVFALKLGTQLGGVALYQNEKIRRQTFSAQARQPEIKDIYYADKYIKHALIIIALIPSLLAALLVFAGK